MSSATSLTAKSTATKLAEGVSTAALFLMPACMVSVKSGSSYAAALLLISGLVLLLATRRFHLPQSAWLLYLSFVPIALVWMLDDYVSGSGASSFDKPSKIFASVLALYFVARYPSKLKWLWWGLGVGAVIAAAQATYHIFVLHMYRAHDGSTFAIVFGDLCLLLGVALLTAWQLPQRRTTLVHIIVIGVLASLWLYASMLSGTRGAWLGLGVIISAYLLYCLFSKRFKTLGIVAILSVTMGTFAWNIPALKVQARINDAQHEVQAFKTEGQAATSVGARLQMWQHAWDLFEQKPLLGWTSQGYLNAKKQGIEEKRLDPYLSELNHPHNEVLNALSKTGLVGLSALLLAYIGPFLVFANIFRGNQRPDVRAVASIGMLLPIAYFGFGLTETFMPHNPVITAYVYWSYILWGWCYHQRAPH